MSNFRYKKDLLNLDSWVINIGAHEGNIITGIVKSHGCNALAIEPSMSNYLRLLQRIKNENLQGRIHPVCCAVTRMNWPVRFYEYEHDKEGEADNTILIDGKEQKMSYDVMGLTLRSVMAKYGLLDRQIDLLLLDCEGAEWWILDEILFERLRIRQICLEFHPDILDSRVINFLKVRMLEHYDIMYDDRHKNVGYIIKTPSMYCGDI